MAKIRGGGVFSRFLSIIAVVVLALPAAIALPALGQGAPAYGATAPPAGNSPGSAPGPGSSRGTPLAMDLGERAEHIETSPGRCRPRRGGRSAPAASAPTPLSTPLPTPLSAALALRPVGRTVVRAAPAGRRPSVPLSRSGELPLRHGVFRC